jgi:hypothetical protein
MINSFPNGRPKSSNAHKKEKNKLFAMAGLRESWKLPNWELVPLWNKGIVRCSSEK